MLTRLGLLLPSSGSPSFEQLVETARWAEDNGFDSLWVDDSEDAKSDFEAYTLLGALAERTSTCLLGAIYGGCSKRPPSILAKQAITLDLLSKGRALLGIGPDLQTNPHAGSLDRLEETIQICEELFTKDAVHFEGSLCKVDVDPNPLRPYREGGPPIVVWGPTQGRSLRFVVEHAQAIVCGGAPDEFAGVVETLRAVPDQTGRKFDVIALGRQADADEYAAAGADGMIVSDVGPKTGHA